MKKLEWPGIATAVGVALICTIVFAILNEPDFKLSVWQPLMASLVALFAACLAYKGAMARIEFDEVQYNSRERQRIRGLSMRASFAAEALANEVTRSIRWITGAPDKKRTISEKDLIFIFPAALQEAWLALDVLPGEIGLDLANIQTAIATLQGFLDRLPEDERVWEYKKVERPTVMTNALAILQDLDDCSRRVSLALKEHN